MVITGAGISAGSGIPTYRDHQGNWLGSQPIQHQEFLDHPLKRNRYWTRSAVGWPAVEQAQANAAHRSLTQLEKLGHIQLLVTQNVDRLHQKSGHQNVIDLHGRLDRVQCLECHEYEPRNTVQQRILRQNKHLVGLTAGLAPDGDAAVPDQSLEKVVPPDCLQCGGVLMPDVVFFGGAVPKQRVETITAALDNVTGLLAIGTSLTVYSGFRFCQQAAAQGLPLALLNQGQTRADHIATLKIEADCVEILAGVTAILQSTGLPGIKS